MTFGTVCSWQSLTWDAETIWQGLVSTFHLHNSIYIYIMKYPISKNKFLSYKNLIVPKQNYLNRTQSSNRLLLFPGLCDHALTLYSSTLYVAYLCIICASHTRKKKRNWPIIGNRLLSACLFRRTYLFAFTAKLIRIEKRTNFPQYENEPGYSFRCTSHGNVPKMKNDTCEKVPRILHIGYV